MVMHDGDVVAWPWWGDRRWWWGFFGVKVGSFRSYLCLFLGGRLRSPVFTDHRERERERGYTYTH